MRQTKYRSRRGLAAVPSKATAFSRPSAGARSSRRMPWLWILVAGLASVLIIAAPVAEAWLSQPVHALLALDVSDSSFDDRQAIEAICREQTKALKPRDRLIDLVFADITEPTANQVVTSPTRSFGRCNTYADPSARPGRLGQGWGTSPIILFDRIVQQLQLQHRQGHTQPAAIVVWLDEAEPGPGLPPLDFDVLGKKVKQLQELQAQVTIVGPTGQLREGLERLSLAHPNLRICGANEAKSCIQATFAAARQR